MSKNERLPVLYDVVGTPGFMAPEMWDDIRKPGQACKAYSFPVDRWAAGILMYVIINGGKHPFLLPPVNHGGPPLLDKACLFKGDLHSENNREVKSIEES